MTTGTSHTSTDAELLALRGMKKLGFDTSSLNRLARDPNIDALCATLGRARCAPLLSAVAVLEILKWADESGRDVLLAAVAKLRRIADYKLLPLPHEVVEAEFRAWLTDQPAAVFGGEPISEGMQSILERAEALDPSWRKAAVSYTRAEQRSFRARVLELRTHSAQLPDAVVAGTAKEFLQGFLGARDSLAVVLNTLFSPETYGQPSLTADEAVRCIENLPSLRAYFVSLGLAAFHHAIQGKSTRKQKGAPGAIDVAQAAYVPLTDVFVVDDAGMLRRMREVVHHAHLSTSIVLYRDLPADLAVREANGTRVEVIPR